MVTPTSDHWAEVKRVLRYLKGSIDFGLIYKKGVRNLKVICYRNSDFADDVKDRKSTKGNFFFNADLPITSNNLKQKVVALYAWKPKYIVITSVVCQGVWILRLVKEIMGIEIEAVKILVDKPSCLPRLQLTPKKPRTLIHVTILYKIESKMGESSSSMW